MPENPPELPDLLPGWVWLVGAGPGDPGLLTLLAQRALTHADVIVHDALVDPRVLALRRPGARLMPAGKRGGRPSPGQPDISASLVRLAGEGQRVLRLKGGDPLIFGRGGEEALALVAAGIPFRIVPGITAGIGAAAYAGIPLTHRVLASAVTFVTGHAAGGGPAVALDWAAIARGSPVIVGYMALTYLDDIARRLIAHGRHGDEPVAVIAQATTPGERIVVTSLANAAADAVRAAIEPPALVVIGSVVRLRAGLDWQGALAGRKLVADPLRRPDSADAL